MSQDPLQLQLQTFVDDVRGALSNPAGFGQNFKDFLRRLAQLVRVYNSDKNQRDYQFEALTDALKTVYTSKWDPSGHKEIDYIRQAIGGRSEAWPVQPTPSSDVVPNLAAVSTTPTVPPPAPATAPLVQPPVKPSKPTAAPPTLFSTSTAIKTRDHKLTPSTSPSTIEPKKTPTAPPKIPPTPPKTSKAGPGRDSQTRLPESSTATGSKRRAVTEEAAGSTTMEPPAPPRKRAKSVTFSDVPSVPSVGYTHTPGCVGCTKSGSRCVRRDYVRAFDAEKYTCWNCQTRKSGCTWDEAPNIDHMAHMVKGQGRYKKLGKAKAKAKAQAKDDSDEGEDQDQDGDKGSGNEIDKPMPHEDEGTGDEINKPTPRETTTASPMSTQKPTTKTQRKKAAEEQAAPKELTTVQPPSTLTTTPTTRGKSRQASAEPSSETADIDIGAHQRIAKRGRLEVSPGRAGEYARPPPSRLVPPPSVGLTPGEEYLGSLIKGIFAELQDEISTLKETLQDLTGDVQILGTKIESTSNFTGQKWDTIRGTNENIQKTLDDLRSRSYTPTSEQAQTDLGKASTWRQTPPTAPPISTSPAGSNSERGTLTLRIPPLPLMPPTRPLKTFADINADSGSDVNTDGEDVAMDQALLANLGRHPRDITTSVDMAASIPVSMDVGSRPDMPQPQAMSPSISKPTTNSKREILSKTTLPTVSLEPSNKAPLPPLAPPRASTPGPSTRPLSFARLTTPPSQTNTASGSGPASKTAMPGARITKPKKREQTARMTAQGHRRQTAEREPSPMQEEDSSTTEDLGSSAEEESDRTSTDKGAGSVNEEDEASEEDEGEATDGLPLSEGLSPLDVLSPSEGHPSLDIYPSPLAILLPTYAPPPPQNRPPPGLAPPKDLLPPAENPPPSGAIAPRHKSPPSGLIPPTQIPPPSGVIPLSQIPPPSRVVPPQQIPPPLDEPTTEGIKVDQSAANDSRPSSPLTDLDTVAESQIQARPSNHPPAPPPAPPPTRKSNRIQESAKRQESTKRKAEEPAVGEKEAKKRRE